MTIALTSLAYDLRIACQQVSRRVRFEPSAELPPHEVSVLGKLTEGPKTPGELAELERISAPSLTKTANCLTEKGLIERFDHPSDGRSKLLAITDAGREALARVARVRDSWMYAKLQGLSEEEREVLRQAVGILNRQVLA
ncbi:MAG: MarR family transcriptional regulator [Propionicimonas sp.]